MIEKILNRFGYFKKSVLCSEAESFGSIETSAFDKTGWTPWVMYGRGDYPTYHCPIDIMRDGWASPATIIHANHMHPLANVDGLWWRKSTSFKDSAQSSRATCLLEITQ